MGMRTPPPQIDPNEKLLPPGHTEPAGPLVGTIIVVLLLVFGALYFVGASLNRRAPIDTPNAAAAAATQQR